VQPIQIVTMSSSTITIIPFVEVMVFESLWPYKRQGRAENGGVFERETEEKLKLNLDEKKQNQEGGRKTKKILKKN